MSRKKRTPEEIPVLNIPEDEIWTYKIDGLTAPQIGVAPKNATAKKIAVIAILVVAIGLSIFFSVLAVQSDTYDYEPAQNGVELIKYSNPGDVRSLVVDKIEDQTVSEIHDYAFNCDEYLTEITIGKDVEKISSKSIYSVWNLQAIHVDPENEHYCDVDGVLYTKDLTEIVCYPIDHDAYLREKFGYKEELGEEDEGFEEYKEKVLSYTLPATVKVIEDLSMNYAPLRTVYLPEGLEKIGSMAFFKSWDLEKVITIAKDGSQYNSLPEGLKYIGSDAFGYNQSLEYAYIPASVTYIGHHAFWDTVYKDGGELKGVSIMNIARDEASFASEVEAGDHWIPQYDSGLFKKNIEVSYSAQRQ